MAVWNRGRRADGDNKEDDEEEFVSLSDGEHAWWAAREDLERPWSPKEKPEPVAPEETSQFKRQFSSESLFDWAEGTDTFAAGEPETQRDASDPLAVLGLTTGATWDEVVSAHRQLAKVHHPDRLQDADPEQRAASEQTMRRVNAAYRVLRERFRPAES